MERNDELYKKAMAAKSDAVLSYVGKRLAEESDAEFDELRSENSELKMPEDLRKRLEGMVLDAENIETVRPKKHRVLAKKLGAVACIALAVLVGTITFMPNTVEAVKDKFRNFIMEEETTHITLTPNGEENGLPDDIPATWNGFWYPSYLPEGYYFDLTLEEWGGELKQIVFKNDSDGYLYITQEPAAGSTITLDNEANESGTVSIKNLYDGYWVKTGKEYFLVWIQADIIFDVRTTIDLEEIVKIAESLKYY